MTEEILQNAILILEDNRGIYIPADFASDFTHSNMSNITEADLHILQLGPHDNDEYWSTWEHVLDNVILTDPNTGQKYSLYQDGDLWLVPEEES